MSQLLERGIVATPTAEDLAAMVGPMALFDILRTEDVQTMPLPEAVIPHHGIAETVTTGGRPGIWLGALPEAVRNRIAQGRPADSGATLPTAFNSSF